MVTICPEGDSCYYILTQLPWLLHVLNILGQENANFLGDSSCYTLLQLYWLLYVLNILGQENATT